VLALWLAVAARMREDGRSLSAVWRMGTGYLNNTQWVNEYDETKIFK
jgi:hypothetical protein